MTSTRRRHFFGSLFGWEFTLTEGTDNYYTFTNKGRVNGGIMGMDENWGEMPPMWTVYFSVADIEATVAKATELGGKVMNEIMDAGGVGRFAMIADPAGATAAYIQLEQPQPWDL